MLVTKENILSIIPQRLPFVMVDQLIYSDEKTSRTQLLVREENVFVDNQSFTEPGLVENIAQTAAARAGYLALRESQPVQIGYIAGIKDLEIFAFPKVQDLLETEVTIKHQVFDVTIISGSVRCNQEVLAQCEMKIFIKPPK